MRSGGSARFRVTLYVGCCCVGLPAWRLLALAWRGSAMPGRHARVRLRDVRVYGYYSSAAGISVVIVQSRVVVIYMPSVQYIVVSTIVSADY